jgi:hypothetical protein
MIFAGTAILSFLFYQRKGGKKGAKRVILQRRRRILRKD